MAAIRILALMAMAASVAVWAVCSLFWFTMAAGFSVADRFNGNHTRPLVVGELCLFLAEALVLILLRQVVRKS